VTPELAALVQDVPDYPQQGIVFKDLTPLLADGDGLRAVVEELAGHHAPGTVDKVAGIEARGFLLAGPVALALGVGVVPIRKSGKLPREVHETSYELEYGSNAIAVHRDAFAPGERVLVVDDVLATGGTAAAAVHLVERSGAVAVGVSVVLELGFLDGRRALPGVDVRALLTA